VQAYEKACPKDKITIQTFGADEIKTKVRVSMAAGQPPTAFFNWGGGILKQYIDARGVYDLTKAFASRPSWKKAFFASSLDAVTFNNHIYGVPNQGTQPVFMFYNKAVFKQLNLTPPGSWDQLLSDVATIKQAGIAPIALANKENWPGLMYLEYLTDRIGGPKAFNDVINGKANAWSNPAILDALAHIQQLVKAGAFENGFNSTSATGGTSEALLYSGKAAMELDGIWVVGQLLAANKSFVTSGDMGYLPFPSVPGGKGKNTDLVGNTSTYYSISNKASAAQKALAVDFLSKEFSTPDFAIRLVAAGQVPVLKGSAKYFAGSQLESFDNYVVTRVASAPSFQYSWDQALGPDKATPLLANLALVFDLSETPQQFAAAMNALK